VGLMARYVVRRKKGHALGNALAFNFLRTQRARRTLKEKHGQDMNLCNQLGLYSMRAAIKCPHDEMHTHTHQKIRFKGTVYKFIRRLVCFLIFQSLNTPLVEFLLEKLSANCRSI
jgi:hypothetical protein